MPPLILEREIGDDLILVNAQSQTLCILDETGKEVWDFFKKVRNMDRLRAEVEVPENEKRAFEEFCVELQMFLDGKSRDPSQGLSLQQYFAGREVPFVVGLEINTRCQLLCRHCYNPQRYPKREYDKQHIDLSLPLVKAMAEDLKNLGTPFVIITGGEPLLHWQFLEICETLSGSGIALKVFTNGYAMTPQIAKALAKMNIFLVGFTLFGSTAEHHEYISQVKGSFDRIVNAIKLVKGAGVPVDATFFLMKHNFDSRFEMSKWAVEEFSVSPSFSFSLTPRETGSQEPFELEITPVQMQIFFDETGITREAFQCGDTAIVPCAAGKTLVSIKANGDITPCISLLHPVGNIHNSSFLEIWRNSPELKKFRNLKLQDISECASCPHTAICLRCFVNAKILGGDVFGSDPHACKVTEVLLSGHKYARKEGCV